MDGIFGFLGIGGTQLLLLMGAVLLLFGPKKLPELARGIGKSLREFKKASDEVTDELERTFDDPPKKYYPPEDYSRVEDSIPRALSEPSPAESVESVSEPIESESSLGELPPPK